MKAGKPERNRSATFTLCPTSAANISSCAQKRQATRWFNSTSLPDAQQDNHVQFLRCRTVIPVHLGQKYGLTYYVLSQREANDIITKALNQNAILQSINSWTIKPKLTLPLAPNSCVTS